MIGRRHPSGPQARPIVRPGRLVAIVLAAAICAPLSYGAYRFLFPPIPGEHPHPLARGLSDGGLTTAHFVAEPPIAEFPPQVKEVAFPIHEGDNAIWGATGRDRQGHIWFATSSYQHPVLTARLYEYDPAADQVTPRGDVLDELKKAGKLRAVDQQPKIHTKIVECGDGHLYFASMDEPLPGMVGEQPPPFGSHLWRLRMPERRWEHLLACEEGLIALTGGGSYVFALAFPNHTLVRYDVVTGEVRRLAVGTVEGHVSRNLFMDSRGHVFVPRLRYSRPYHAEHTLVEFSPDLLEIGESPLREYQNGPAPACHGIIAFTHLADRSVVFTTHAGRLYRVVPQPLGASLVLDLGHFHPEGKAYAPSLFTFSGQRHIYGIARREWNGKEHFEWIHHDLVEKRSQAMPLLVPNEKMGSQGAGGLLYGCQTIDNAGGCYVVGSRRTAAETRPVVLRISSPIP